MLADSLVGMHPLIFVLVVLGIVTLLVFLVRRV